MTYRQVFTVKDNKLVLDLPAGFKDKQVVVTVDDMPVTTLDKIALMRQAANDPLYLADLQEVNDDFRHIEHETL